MRVSFYDVKFIFNYLNIPNECVNVICLKNKYTLDSFTQIINILLLLCFEKKKKILKYQTIIIDIICPKQNSSLSPPLYMNEHLNMCIVHQSTSNANLFYFFRNPII